MRGLGGTGRVEADRMGPIGAARPGEFSESFHMFDVRKEIDMI